VRQCGLDRVADLVPLNLHPNSPRLRFLRERAAAVITTVPSCHAGVSGLIFSARRSSREVTFGDVGEQFADQVFLALAGISHHSELPQAISERRTPFLAKLANDHSLADDEVAEIMDYLVIAGHRGIVLAIKFVLEQFQARPALSDELRRDPQRTADFVDEVFRTQPAFPTIVRSNTEAVTVAGVEIPAGSRVELCIGALAHAPGGRLDFGAGVHQCMGRHLSKMAIHAFVEEWLTL
jgi:Cytochrome P450